MLGEELVELVAGSILVLVDLEGELLAEHQCVREATVDGRETAQHHGEEGVEGRHLGA